MANLPPEKINELKQLIHNHLNQSDIHSRIKSCLDDSLSREYEARKDNLNIDENNIMNLLRERGVINDVMKTLKFDRVGRKVGNEEKQTTVQPSTSNIENSSKQKGFVSSFLNIR